MPQKSVSDSTSGGGGKRRRDSANIADADDGEREEDCPACQSCRKKKAKCSRQQPCRQCLRLQIECVYDDKKQRPGMRTGAIENLNQRLTTLEQMFIGQGILLRPLFERALDDPGDETSAANVRDRDGIAAQGKQIKSTLINASHGATSPTPGYANHTQKRQRNVATPKPVHDDGLDPDLPPWDTVLELVEYYFKYVHPWMPILHVRQFRQQLHDQSQRSKIKAIVQAIVSLCLRFNDSAFAMSNDKKRLSLQYRNAVILQGMEQFSVENLQAMLIVAFDIIGSGRGPSAWSVIGSMTRTAEHLQLSVEDGEDVDEQTESTSPGSFIGRMSFLRPAQTWVESEGRRRVFWTIFLMDRFCSVATGWNNSLTSADVRRRLPCEGAIWEEGTPVRTPYFGIAERSNLSPEQVSTPSSGRKAANEEEIDSLGGFAFFVEATESLNLVTTLFLRQPVDFGLAQQVQLWLMHFKELDLRLVKWRLFLPSRWGNASVLNEQGVMDPNLTLAHITHNTAVVQLHQFMAYPSQHLRTCPISLPSASSAETCMTAATEISNIAHQYLSMSEGITTPQFALCLFVAGRVLLAHSAYTQSLLSPAFDELLASLSEISSRWAGGVNVLPGDCEDSLASRFATRLKRAKEALRGSTKSNIQDALDFRRPVYCGDAEYEWATSIPSAAPVNASPGNSTGMARPPVLGTSPGALHAAYSGLPDLYQASSHSPMSLQANFDMDRNTMVDQPQARTDDFGQFSQYPEGELNSLAGLFDQPFQEMLRVSTYGGTQDFSSNGI